MASGDSDLVFGHSYGSGVGMNAFITDIGISQDDTYGAILVSGSVADASKQQTTAERFFDSFRSKFWNDGESYKMTDTSYGILLMKIPTSGTSVHLNIASLDQTTIH